MPTSSRPVNKLFPLRAILQIIAGPKHLPKSQINLLKQHKKNVNVGISPTA
jgi:hypothetical protein